MTKQEEYHLRFKKSTTARGSIVYHLDSSDAIGEYKRLGSFSFLPKYAVENLLDNLNKITNNLPFLPDFLEEDYENQVMMITFSTPYFSIGGVQTIHMNDLKPLLQEWLIFIST